MITVSDTARSLIDSGTFTYVVRASAWLGDELLAETVPIEGGSEESDRSLRVPERITFTVPRRAAGVDWSPAADTDPLAAKGQTIRLELGVGLGPDGVEWLQRGEYLITECESSATTVEVSAAGLLYLTDEAKLAAPFQPTGTFQSALRKLLEPAVTVDFDLAPTNRSIPASSATWDTDRLGAVLELLDAWPADARMSHLGTLVVVPEVAPTVSVRSLTDATGGTLITGSGMSRREGMTNMVMVTGYDTAGAELRAGAYASAPVWTAGSGVIRRVDVKMGSPWAYGHGPAANPRPAAPVLSLLRTLAEASAAAKAVLRRELRRGVVREFTIETTPDPTLEIGDPIDITSTDLGVSGLLCTIEALTLPLEPGPMMIRAVTAV